VPLRNNEPLAAEALERLLSGSGVASTWEPGPNPPDLVFTVAGKSWAVEETQLHQYLAAKTGDPLEAASFRESFAAMCRRIDEQTRSFRTDSYLITAFLPLVDVLPPRASAASEDREAGSRHRRDAGDRPHQTRRALRRDLGP
jgi:hypothetical protein